MTEAPQPGMAVLENGQLRVTVDPLVGGTICAVDHVGLGLSVLGRTPWDPIRVPYLSTSPADEHTWLARYGGGWPLLFPNGGDGCDFEGVQHGFHGEASVAPWQIEADADVIRLTRRFYTVPVEMVRELTLDGDVLRVNETVRMEGRAPARVMWTHHPTFGADLLAGEIAIETSACSVTVDDGYDPDTNPLRPGATSVWPMVEGKEGAYDLSRPAGTVASLAYLHDFDPAWVALRRLDGALGAALSWDAAHFPCAWLWFELNGTSEAPWYGRARLIGVEPSTSRPGTGLADIERRGGSLLTLEPGDLVATELCLHVFKPTGPVHGVDADGRVMTDRDS
jgi:galactose mutarotase-like enzyme